MKGSWNVPLLQGDEVLKLLWCGCSCVNRRRRRVRRRRGGRRREREG